MVLGGCRSFLLLVTTCNKNFSSLPYWQFMYIYLCSLCTLEQLNKNSIHMTFIYSSKEEKNTVTKHSANNDESLSYG